METLAVVGVLVSDHARPGSIRASASAGGSTVPAIQPARFVDTAPFDPHDVERLTPEQELLLHTASQWQPDVVAVQAPQDRRCRRRGLLLCSMPHPGERGEIALRRPYPQRAFHPRAAAGGAFFHEGLAESALRHAYG